MREGSQTFVHETNLSAIDLRSIARQGNFFHFEGVVILAYKGFRPRTIHPGYFSNEELAACDRVDKDFRILFAGLWCLADREGRLEDRPDRIRVQVFPYNPHAKVDRGLHELARRGFIIRYSATVDGERRKFLQVINFLEHQTPHRRESKCHIPAPPGAILVKGRSKDSPKTDQGQPKDSPRTARSRSRSRSRSSTKNSTYGTKAVAGEPPPQPPKAGPQAARPPHDSGHEKHGETKTTKAAGHGLKSKRLRPPEGTPGDNVKIITRLAHEAIDHIGIDHDDLIETTKQLCANNHIAYDSPIVRKAVESAQFQRRHQQHA